VELRLVTVAAFSLVVLIAGLAILLPVNIRLTVRDAMLVVEPRGLDVLLTLRRRIMVPISQIVSVQVASRAQANQPGSHPPRVRRPGTAVAGVAFAGVVTAGSYGTAEYRAFWDVRRRDALLMINCTPASPYRKLVLEFADPYLAVTQLRDALAL
jgi:hypothetical protein